MHKLTHHDDQYTGERKAFNDLVFEYSKELETQLRLLKDYDIKGLAVKIGVLEFKVNDQNIQYIKAMDEAKLSREKIQNDTIELKGNQKNLKDCIDKLLVDQAELKLDIKELIDLHSDAKGFYHILKSIVKLASVGIAGYSLFKIGSIIKFLIGI